MTVTAVNNIFGTNVNVISWIEVAAWNIEIIIPIISEALKMGSEHFVDCILNNKTPVTDGRAGLEVVKVLVASKESLQKKS